ASAPVVLAPGGVSRLLPPLTVLQPEWVGSRIEVVTAGLGRFREHPATIVTCFGGAVIVQALAVLFYGAIEEHRQRLDDDGAAETRHDRRRVLPKSPQTGRHDLDAAAHPLRL